MTELEWLASEDPDLMMECLIGRIDRRRLVEYVRECWERITPYLPPTTKGPSAAEQFAAIVGDQTDFDAATYAAEAILKAARWAPDVREEQRQQAELLRRLFGNPFQPDFIPSPPGQQA